MREWLRSAGKFIQGAVAVVVLGVVTLAGGIAGGWGIIRGLGGATQDVQTVSLAAAVILTALVVLFAATFVTIRRESTRAVQAAGIRTRLDQLKKAGLSGTDEADDLRESLRRLEAADGAASARSPQRIVEISVALALLACGAGLLAAAWLGTEGIPLELRTGAVGLAAMLLMLLTAASASFARRWLRGW